MLWPAAEMAATTNTELSMEAMERRQEKLWAAFNDRETRVRAYAASGVQIGLPGAGEGDNRLTFPRCFLVGDALRAVHWIRFATAAEMAQMDHQMDGHPQWWRFFKTDKDGFQPAEIVYDNAVIAAMDMPIGLEGDVVLVKPGRSQVAYEEKPCANVSGIQTPPTPPPRFH